MTTNWREAKSIYDFSVENLDGKDVKLQKYQNKVLLIVNIASRCGFTSQNFKELNELHAKYSPRGLAILGFPCNQFGMEPRTNDEIKAFISEHNVEWDMFAKVNVNGDSSIPLYKWLKHNTESTAFLPKTLKWNYTKFIVDRRGQPVARYAPSTSPLAFEQDIQRELGK